MGSELINREVLNEIWNLYKKYQPYLATNVYEFGVALKDLIDNAPAIEYTFEEAFQKTVCEKQLYCPERPQGEWITNKEYIDKEFNGHYEGSCFNSPYNCSCCGYSPEDNRPKFCPNCGADMRKGG